MAHVTITASTTVRRNEAGMTRSIYRKVETRLFYFDHTYNAIDWWSWTEWDQEQFA